MGERERLSHCPGLQQSAPVASTALPALTGCTLHDPRTLTFNPPPPPKIGAPVSPIQPDLLAQFSWLPD